MAITVTTPATYVSPLQSGIQFTFVACSEIYKDDELRIHDPKVGIRVTRPSGQIAFEQGIAEDGRAYDIPYDQAQGYTEYPLLPGYYTVHYVYTYRTGDPTPFTRTATYTFLVVENYLPLKTQTVTDVLLRLFDLAEPIRKGESPRFVLSGVAEDGSYTAGGQAEQFDLIRAPQFTFTKSTLRECLQEVGKIVHGEPRLTPKQNSAGTWYYEVSYDLFGQTERSGIYARPYILKTVSQNINNYATHIDTNAENLVNQLDKYSGVITEPYANAAKTVRTDSVYTRIEETNMLIATQFPIYSVEKLYWFNPDGSIYVDITPWLFESSVYNSRLSSYDNLYPYSKAYAISYTQDEKNITNLSFKQENPVSPIFSNYAILNILRQATNNPSLSISDYTYLAFQVVYTPIYNSRVLQSKPYYKDQRGAALIYNQQANLIETRNYGENLKGAIARIGNIEKTLTYKLARIGHVPKAGMMFDSDYYISAVYTEYMATFIKVTLALSKDFNRLSQYVGVNSVRRFSQISETQAYERNLLYREYIVIGDQETPDASSYIGNNLFAAIMDTFTQTGNYIPISNVVAWGQTYQDYTQDVTSKVTGEISSDGSYITLSLPNTFNQSITITGAFVEQTGTATTTFPINIITSSQTARVNSRTGGTIQSFAITSATITQNLLPPVSLPVVSSAFGNSLSFSWAYADNFSAGAIATYASNGDVSGLFQSDYQYPDYYGKMYYYNFDLQEAGEASTPSNYTVIGTTVPGALALPSESSKYFSTIGKQPYLLRKDNREKLQGNVQIDFVTNRKDMIIGSALAAYCGLVRGSDATLAAKLYVLPETVNKFIYHAESSIPQKLSSLPSVDITVTESGNGYFITADTIPADGAAWAIITNQTTLPAVQVQDDKGNVFEEQEVKGGDVLLAENVAVTAGETLPPIYFTKKRKVFKEDVWKTNIN